MTRSLLSEAPRKFPRSSMRRILCYINEGVELSFWLL